MFKIEKARSLEKGPFKRYEWEFFIPNPPALVAPFITAFPLTARSVQLPGISVESFQTQFGAMTFQHPGKKKYPYELLVRFEQGKDVEAQIYAAMYMWNAHVFDETTAKGVSEPSLTADIIVMMVDEEDNPVFGAHLYGAYPGRVVDTTLDYSAEDQVVLDVTFMYSYWVLEPLNVLRRVIG